jgi:hypothetical protein
MQVVGDRAGMLNKFMVDYLNESFHLSTHLSALARVFFMAAGMLTLHSSPQLFAVTCCSCVLSTLLSTAVCSLPSSFLLHSVAQGAKSVTSQAGIFSSPQIDAGEPAPTCEFWRMGRRHAATC